MNNPQSPILNPQSLLLALALLLLPACGHVQSLSVNGGYTPETGQITGGATIVFRDAPPAPALAAQLVDAGFTQTSEKTFRIVGAMRSMASDRATRAALDAGAVILPDRPAKPAPRPGATLAPPARNDYPPHERAGQQRHKQSPSEMQCSGCQLPGRYAETRGAVRSSCDRESRQELQSKQAMFVAPSVRPTDFPFALPARHPQSAGVWVNSAAPVTPGAATPFLLCLSAPLRLCAKTDAFTAETQRRKDAPKSPILNPQSSTLV